MNAEKEYIVGPVDTPTVNGRIYPRKVVERAITEYKWALDEHRSIGCLDMENVGFHATVDLNTASHLVSSMSIVDGNFVASIVSLDTPKGKLLHELLDAGEICFRPVGTGEFIEGTKTLSSYSLISINAYRKKDCE